MNRESSSGVWQWLAAKGSVVLPGSAGSLCAIVLRKAQHRVKSRGGNQSQETDTAEALTGHLGPAVPEATRGSTDQSHLFGVVTWRRAGLTLGAEARAQAWILLSPRTSELAEVC